MNQSSKSHSCGKERHNQALERTAAQRAFTFEMSKTVSVEATLSLRGGRSALSR
jgi:hypothetical protein